ncbi:MAG TPA: T9SS type A sorting domain-containing protein, partial [Paludibacter sp.]|nr:T9SS type A sorting domain-containing protein [Paludibacter sp.]
RKNPAYNPAKALKMIQPLADAGNAEASNMVGVILSRGLADSLNYKVAFDYFRQAANNGYANAWANLGLMYKEGLGVDQDFQQAYQCFGKGAGLNSTACIYSKGYMLYKGLGCEQNYELAVTLFKSAVENNCLGSMYMLGLCYRNGYGITQNTDSARYWLQRASDAGYRWATDELMAKDAENASATSNGAGSNGPQRVGAKNKQGPTAYKRVKHNVARNSMEGDYTGYAIKYDWSGQNVIGKSTLKLTLVRKDSLLTGTWTEDDSIQTDIHALASDSAIVFNNTGYSRRDHYNQLVPNQFVFKNATLQLVQLSDSVYFAGNLQLYSSTNNEPEKPMYIVLTKVSELLKKDSPDVFSSQKKVKSSAEPVEVANTELIVYPNPFKNSCNVTFNLDNEQSVTIKLIDMSGKVMCTQTGLFPKGKNTSLLDTPLPTGSYILCLTTQTKTERTILIKQQNR